MPDNFATIEDIEDFLQVSIESPHHIFSATRALEEATAAIRNWCRQFVSFVDDDEITLDTYGGTRIFLPELPAISVTSVIENGITLVPGEDYVLGQHGILHRIGRAWPVGIQSVTIIYTHGFDPLPDDIVAVATRAASRSYQAGLRAAESDGVLGVSSKSLGDFSVAFSSETGGGIGEGVMGASSARMLLMSEKEILNRYRVKGP